VAKKARGPQQDTIPRQGDLPQISFNLPKQDAFITSHGVQFEHWRATPSPIGKRERGDYRRSDQLDDQQSNGFLYDKVGCFTAVLTGNSKKRGQMDGGVIDASVGRITLPRFYDVNGGLANGERIYLCPGDRVYVRNKEIDTRIPNFHEMAFEPDRDNVTQFPVHKVERLVDSRGVDYRCGEDFTITQEGNIRWSAGKGPGVDPETGRGRVYSVRYLYEAHWYVVQLINEVRIGNVTQGGVRKEERMPYHAQVVREYVYYNRMNSAKQTDYKHPKEDRKRTNPGPGFDAKPNSPFVRVSMTDIEDEGED
jgi:hypothetical protein